MSEIAVWCLSARGLSHVNALADTLSVHCFLPRGKGESTGDFPVTLFDRLEPAVREAFLQFPAHLFVMATGIVVRTIGSLLQSKLTDPAVLVMDEEARHVISLVSGHLGGANALTEQIAVLTGADPVITTATDVAGLTSFDTLARQLGAKVEPKEAIKATATALLEKRPVALLCEDALYAAIRDDFPAVTHFQTVDHESLPTFDAVCIVSDTLQPLPPEWEARTLWIRPPTIACGVGCNRGTSREEIESAIQKTVKEHRLSIHSVFCLASVDPKADEPGLKASASALGIPLRTYPKEALNAISERVEGLSPVSEQAMKHLGVRGVAEPAALLAAGENARLIVPKQKRGNVTVALARRPVPLPERQKGKLMVVGIGPGDPAYLTAHAKRALREADTLVGYTKYIRMIAAFIPGKEVIQTGMTREIERVTAALEAAAAGRNVALIGTGDAGIYGLAGLAYEFAAKTHPDLSIDVSPGITAAICAAAVVGAPLTNDYITLSLSDLLTPTETVLSRIEAAAASGMVTAIYNPKSKRRTYLITKLRETFLKHRSPDTAVAIVTHALRKGQSHVITTLQAFLNEEITMNSIVIIGNRDTVVQKTPRGPRMVTRRGYERKGA